MGVHHFERTSATRMASSISESFHSVLIKHINSENIGPISIILDSSVDNTAENHLIVYLRALEQNEPRVYFYRMLKIEGSETADALSNLLISAFERDGIQASLKTNPAGFASDGASVMIGHKSGVLEKMRTYTGRPLYGIHCMAHQLHLASRKVFALPQLMYFEDIYNK